MEILIKRLDEQAKLPAYSNEAGPEIELYSLYDVTVEPGSKVSVSTGIAMALTIGYVGLVWNKSGVTTDTVIKLTPSIVDSGYREEIKVELTNEGSESFTIGAGEKVAQFLIQKIERANIIEAEDLSDPVE